MSARQCLDNACHLFDGCISAPVIDNDHLRDKGFALGALVLQEQNGFLKHLTDPAFLVKGWDHHGKVVEGRVKEALGHSVVLVVEAEDLEFGCSRVDSFPGFAEEADCKVEEDGLLQDKDWMIRVEEGIDGTRTDRSPTKMMSSHSESIIETSCECKKINVVEWAE